jgi:hypothetical protein
MPFDHFHRHKWNLGPLTTQPASSFSVVAFARFVALLLGVDFVDSYLLICVFC